MQTYPVTYLHLKDPYILWFSEYLHSILIFGSIGTLPQISFWCCTHPKICISWGWMCFRRKILVSFSWKELLKHLPWENPKNMQQPSIIPEPSLRHFNFSFSERKEEYIIFQCKILATVPIAIQWNYQSIIHACVNVSKHWNHCQFYKIPIICFSSIICTKMAR